ncbi:hypothetical protein LCGC14_0745460 [marine sediment metagenome]|uniref:Uncharacterized protein n=1 Tax=marine sediment metagenome TaxID=412755 RepID=A0A0F9TCT6_9ZZZZ
MILVILITVGVLSYMGCGILAYGLTLGYFQRHYWDVRRRDIERFARWLALTGPAGLLPVLAMCEFGHHGLLWAADDSEWAKSKTVDRRAMDLTNAHTRYPDREPVVAARSDRPSS